MITLISEAALQARVKEVAKDIQRDAGGEPLLLLGVLKGAFMFMADLMRQIQGDVTCDFISVSSYVGATSSGEVQIRKDVDSPLEGRRVIIIEDIVDTGLTMHYLQGILQNRNPSSLKTACLLSKPSRRKTAVPVDYVGFEIDDKFVVGYGLDFNERYRNLPYIGIVEGGS
ncbi:MAG TPA: hypoxanthine phosphoribosyltransferase [Vicinamibacterales bacterium]|nr:hypoxanthine phosphoribosyltransferase [Vicinamibacterales bacterium]